MICVNPNSPEFQAALQRTGNPLLAEIEVNKAATTPFVKPGVAELFQENPELANAVYEALGFNNNGLQSFKDKLINIIGIDKIKELYSGTDVKFDSFIIDNVELGFDKDLILTIKTNSGQKTAFNLRLDGDYQQLKISEGGKTVRGIKAALSEKKTAIDFLISEFKNLDKQEVTPQQKQQAQQLYSQYLDTIFPESKVKDIVYHGTKRSEKTFEKRTPSEAYGSNAIYFANEDYAKTFGTLIPAILNVTNPFISEQKFMRRRLKPGYESPQGTIDAKDLLSRNKNNDGLVGVDYSDQENNTYVIREPEQIHILGNKQDVEGFRKFVSGAAPSAMFQLQGELETSKASPKTIKLIKEFLNAIGVQYNEVSGIVVNGKKLDANAVADITQKMIQIVEGKTDVALPEEAMHFFVEIVQQTNPQLFNELMKEINNYAILNQTFKEYGNNPYYQKDGKPDVIKIKKEAIGKVLAETIIKKMEGYTERPELLEKTRTLWQKILDWFKRLISDSAFDRASLMVISGEKIGTAEDIRSEEGNVYLSETTRDTIYNKLKAVQSSISKDDDNPDEKKRGYYINGVKIPRRVTDLVNDWYERRFKEKQLNKDEFQKAVFDLKAEKGTLGHKDIEHAFHVFVDDEGFLREEPQDDSTHVSHLNEEDRKMYNILKDNLRERLNSFPEGTRFLSEVIVYNEKRKIAGTIDFLAITKDGEVNILDWKFMDLNVGKYEDVPWYKVNAWRQQMQQYKLILEEAYGVKPENFRQTRMIPIKAYYTEADYKNKILPKLKEIEIGNVKVELIDKSYLIPVGLEKETTGDKNIDELLEKLNGLYSRLSEQRAIGEKEKREKARQLNSLFSAIRQLQMKKSVKQLVQQAKVLNTLIERAVANYEQNWKNVSPTDKIDEEVNRFYEELETLELAAQRTYSSLDTDLEFLFEGKELSEEEQQIWKDLMEVSRRTRTLAKRIDGVTTDFVDKFVAGREGVEDILKPEKVIRNASKQFSLTSTIQTKAMEVLYKKANRVLAYAQQDTISELRRLAELKQAYDTWALSKGLTTKNYYSSIKKKDKNQLIDQFKREFYENLQNAIQEKDFDWIRNNIDVEQYKELLKQRLEDEIESIKNRPVVTEEEERKKKFEIEDAKSLFNISSPTSPGWLLYDTVKKAPNKDKWETDEWKELNKKNDKGEYVNKPALDFYNYIIERNEYFQSIGYINKAEARVFLPYVRKTILEKALMGGNIRLGEEFFRAISIDEGDIGYGERDPLSGEIKDAVPIYMTREIDGEVSEDLFRTMGLYNELAIKYKYLKDVEYQVRALMKVERNKKSIATTQFSKIVRDEGVIKYDESNDENAKLLQDHVKAIIYQQKYISSETFDQLLGKLGKFGEKINEKLGIKIFPENLSERQISINKSIDQLNNTFQLTALGFNVFSALSNYMGGNFQSFINAGKYFTKTDFEKNVIWITTGKLIGNNNQKFLAAIEYFLPLTENYNREFMKQLSLNKMTQENIQQLLMAMMREGDWVIQTSNFFSFLENSVVIDGQVINAREYLRSRPEYQDMYAGSREDRLARESKFQVDLKNLLEEKSVLKDGISNIKEDGTLEIVGVNRKDDSVIKLRRMVQGINSDALGNLSEDNVRSINLNIIGKSFMLFKNWIPRPIDVRMGNLKYNSAVDAYEWGRMRMVFRMLSWNVLKSMKRLIDVYQANDKGVEYMRTLWEKKRQDYKEDTNKDLKMTESQFMDLVRHNVRSATYDAVIMLTLFALVAGLKANAPDDDEDESVKNSYRLLVRAADKLRDELLFFYDPTSLLGTVSSGIFPSLSYITNFTKLVKNFMIENYALAVDDEILEEKNQVIKYLMKTFPVVSFSSGLLPAFYPELAKELGIRATTESRPIGR